MSKDATLKEHEAGQTSPAQYVIRVTQQGASPSPLTVDINDTVSWTGTQEFEVQFTGNSPFQKGKFCAQLLPDGTYQVPPQTVTLNQRHADCPYKLHDKCTPDDDDHDRGHDRHDAAGDPIIIVDCASCIHGKHHHRHEK
jgi:hypothetical protein